MLENYYKKNIHFLFEHYKIIIDFFFLNPFKKINWRSFKLNFFDYTNYKTINFIIKNNF